MSMYRVTADPKEMWKVRMVELSGSLIKKAAIYLQLYKVRNTDMPS